jgi:mono/diheme cytochrome c family protein
MTKVRYLPLAVVALATVHFNITGDVLAAEVPEYTVKDGKVDKGTYNGYRRFHGTCHACHGQDALGGSFAPALVESLKTVDYDTFVKTVTEGRQVTDATGAVNAMPSFGQDPNITKHLDDIYRYLSARADGVLGPGRPKKIPK